MKTASVRKALSALVAFVVVRVQKANRSEEIRMKHHVLRDQCDASRMPATAAKAERNSGAFIMLNHRIQHKLGVSAAPLT